MTAYLSIKAPATNKANVLFAIAPSYKPAILDFEMFAFSRTSPYLPIGTLWTDGNGRVSFYPNETAESIGFYINTMWVI